MLIYRIYSLYDIVKIIKLLPVQYTVLYILILIIALHLCFMLVTKQNNVTCFVTVPGAMNPTFRPRIV